MKVILVHTIPLAVFTDVPVPSSDIPVPSTPELTFINISSVNISWNFDHSAISAAQNVCFVIEFENGTRHANVSSLICGESHTFYIFPWLLRGQRYRFRIHATNGVMTTVGDWSFMFINGIEGKHCTVKR